jgi:hypothetical protein
MKTTRELLDELCAFAHQRHGRQIKVAAILGVRSQSISDWRSGRVIPNWETGRLIEAFAEKSDEERKRAIGEVEGR